jgi:uncharacterized protein (TIGR03663 family)
VICSVAVLAIAAFFRFYLINLNPFHHDEGVNGFFLTTLFRQGTYSYDPANYHGPTLYYFALAAAKSAEFLFGKDAALTTLTVRLVPILFGLATIWLVLQLRSYIGSVGAFMGALFLAVSPGAVYMSRYFIHETLFTFFTLAIVVAAIRFYETTDLFYLIAGAVSAGLLFATKETAVIHAAVLVIALVCVWLYSAMFPDRLDRPGPESKGVNQGRFRAEFGAVVERLGGARWLLIYVCIALLIFVAVNVVFYSSFFKHWKGVVDAVETFKYWTKTGSNEHTKPFYAYVNWLRIEEGSVLFLGTVGALLAVIRGRNRVALFCSLWAFGILAAYSLIKYKTPWIAINFIVPLSIVSGFAIGSLWELSRDALAKFCLVAVTAIALTVGVWQMVSLNYYHYDDDSYPYVYAHTQREFLAMIAEVDRVSKLAGTGAETNIAVMAPEYWPLPWYLSKYGHVGYFGKVSNAGEPIVISTDSQDAEFSTMFSGKYRKVGSYKLRPGVTLSLWVKKDLPY